MKPTWLLVPTVQDNITALEKLATSSGALLYTLSHMMNSLALTLTIEETFQNLKNLEKFAKEDLGKSFAFCPKFTDQTLLIMWISNYFYSVAVGKRPPPEASS